MEIMESVVDEDETNEPAEARRRQTLPRTIHDVDTLGLRELEDRYVARPVNTQFLRKAGRTTVFFATSLTRFRLGHFPQTSRDFV